MAAQTNANACPVLAPVRVHCDEAIEQHMNASASIFSPCSVGVGGQAQRSVLRFGRE